MGKAGGLEVYKVTGPTSKTFYESILGSNCGHAWNAVKIEGNYHLLDCTWAAGSVDSSSGQFTFKFNPYYFLIAPDRLIYSHFPTHPQWQLLPQPYTKEQWEQLPYLREGYFIGHLTLETHPQRVIITHVGQLLDIAVGHGPAWTITTNLTFYEMDQNQKPRKLIPMKENVLVQDQKSNTAHILVVPTHPGIYTLLLCIAHINDVILTIQNGGGKFSTPIAAEYQVIAEPAEGIPTGLSIQSFPKRFSLFQAAGLFLVEPLNGQLKSNSSILFKIGQIAEPVAHKGCELVLLHSETKIQSKLKTVNSLYESQVSVGPPGKLCLTITNGNSFQFVAEWHIV